MMEYLGIDICIVNGMECIIVEDSEVIDDTTLRVKARPAFVDDPDLYFDVEVNKRIFDGYYDIVPDLKTLMTIDREEDRDLVYCDFAYAITCASSQGSEWPKILVIDEMPKWRPEYKYFMYTAATRASVSVDVLLDQ
jgi:ATP-dependent exoDNAse (exonuclease V) alpha subunit